MAHGPHADPNDPFQKRTAVAIAAFTTLLAFSNMLTNEARTQAILSSNRATNRWSHYQSKSTKQQLSRLELSLLSRQPGGVVAEDSARLTAEVDRYEKEKVEIRREAEGFNTVEKAAEHREHYFEYAATIAELAIIIASVALLLSSRKALGLALLVAVVALGLTLYTKFGLPDPPPSASADLAPPH